jgi:hypothetical protein
MTDAEKLQIISDLEQQVRDGLITRKEAVKKIAEIKSR